MSKPLKTKKLPRSFRMRKTRSCETRTSFVVIAKRCFGVEFLNNYLFAESEYLKTFFAENDVNSQSKRLAIYQFLRLAQSLEERFSKGENLPIAEFLQYVKKLAHFNEDKNYAQIPAEAENLDAVRLLTVHSAKGLEFPAVFLPFWEPGKFLQMPNRRLVRTRTNDCGRWKFSRIRRRMSVFLSQCRGRVIFCICRERANTANRTRKNRNF